MRNETLAMSEEDRLVVDGARRLRTELLEPVERELDLLDDADAVDTHPRLHQAQARALDMGLDCLATPAAFGGMEASLAVVLRVTEELATGAPGFVSRLLAEDTLRAVLTEFVDTGADDGVRAVLDGRVAITFVQPDDGAEGVVTLPSSGLGVRSLRYQTRDHDTGTVAWDGQDVQLNETPLPFVADGDRCDHLILLVGSPPDDPRGVAAFRIDVGDARRVTHSPRARTLGMRLEPRAQVVFDGGRLTHDDRMLAGTDVAQLLEQLITASSLRVAAIAVGLATSAHNHAFEYTLTRVQGGRPIVEHQSVAASLWNASSTIDTLRSAIHGSVTPTGAPPPMRVAAALRSTAVEAATRIALDMLELLGGYGVTTEYPMEKLYRDARTLAAASGSLEGTGTYGRVWLP